MSWTNRKQIRRIKEEIKLPDPNTRYDCFETEIVRTLAGHFVKFIKPLNRDMLKPIAVLLTPEEVGKQFFITENGRETFQSIRDSMQQQEEAIKDDKICSVKYEKFITKLDSMFSEIFKEYKTEITPEESEIISIKVVREINILVRLFSIPPNLANLIVLVKHLSKILEFPYENEKMIDIMKILEKEDDAQDWIVSFIENCSKTS